MLVLDTYSKVTGDETMETLVSFYKAKRCLLRAKLAIAHTLEARYRDDSSWRRRAMEYLRRSQVCVKRGQGIRTESHYRVLPETP